MHSGMPRHQFEQVVSDAMDDIPQDLLNRIENVAIVVEDEPPADWQARGWDGHEHSAADGHSELLGLYTGIPLTQRGDFYGFGGATPDTIQIFAGPLTRVSRDPQDLKEQIHRTVIHEVGHYFGINDTRLHELGWG